MCECTPLVIGLAIVGAISIAVAAYLGFLVFVVVKYKE